MQHLDDVGVEPPREGVGQHPNHGVGHWVQQEAPEATTDALLAFLEGLDVR